MKHEITLPINIGSARFGCTFEHKHFKKAHAKYRLPSITHIFREREIGPGSGVWMMNRLHVLGVAPKRSPMTAARLIARGGRWLCASFSYGAASHLRGSLSVTLHSSSKWVCLVAATYWTLQNTKQLSEIR